MRAICFSLDIRERRYIVARASTFQGYVGVKCPSFCMLHFILGLLIFIVRSLELNIYVFKKHKDGTSTFFKKHKDRISTFFKRDEDRTTTFFNRDEDRTSTFFNCICQCLTYFFVS